MIKRNDKQMRGRSKNATLVGSLTRSRRPQMETERSERTPSRLALFTDPPRDKPVYSIGELVTVAYQRAELLAEDAATKAMVATRLLAEWLIHARSTTPLAELSAGPEQMRSATRMHRVPSRRSAFANAPGIRAAA